MATRVEPAGRKLSPIAAGAPSSTAPRTTRRLVHHIAAIAKDCEAAAVFVYVDAVGPGGIELPADLGASVYYATRDVAEETRRVSLGERVIRLPNVALTRLAQVRISLLIARSRGMVHLGDTAVCLTGIADSGVLDTLVVMEVGRQFEMSFEPCAEGQTTSLALPEVLDRVIGIAAEVAGEGREGKPVGALFVVGDTDRVRPMSKQLILNPFQGYSEDQRNILDLGLEETVKELTTIDGAFLIRSDGVVESAGAYLGTPAQVDTQLPSGLGARHYAAAGITALTDAVAVAVSESTGTLTIFHRGRIVTEIEKPHSADRRREF